MAQIWLPSDLTRTNVSLNVAGDALPVRMVSAPPSEPILPSQRLLHAWSLVWRDAPTRPFLIFGFIVLISLVIVLAVASFFGLTMVTSEQAKLPELGYIVEYPPRLVARENEQFSITLVNRSPISLTHVSTTLVFSNVLSVSSDTTVAQFENLAPGERKTRVIHFTLNQPVDRPAVRSAQVILQASTDQFGTVLLDIYTLSIAPLPLIKTIGRWLVGPLSTAMSGMLLWMLRGAFKDILPEK